MNTQIIENLKEDQFLEGHSKDHVDLQVKGICRVVGPVSALPFGEAEQMETKGCLAIGKSQDTTRSEKVQSEMQEDWS